MSEWDDSNPFVQPNAPPATSKPAPPPRPAAAPAADEPAWTRPKEAAQPPPTVFNAPPASTHAAPPQAAPAQAAPPTQDPAVAAAEDLKRQQEFEAREAAAYKLKIERSAVSVIEGRPANFPPFKPGCPTPLKPCFHINMKGEIPPTHRRNIRIMYYLWFYTCFCLLFNFIGNLASLAYDGPGISTSTGLSSLWLVAFICCSFCCWFHCLYTAFRTGSNFRYGWFFFVTMCQLIFSGLMAVGIPYTGGAGFIVAFATLANKNNSAATVIFLSAIFWLLHFLWTLYMSKRLLQVYRAEGGSVAKMRADFNQESSRGIVKMATSEAGQTAISSAAQQQWSSNA